MFNIGANVPFSMLETTERVFRKVWEMACYRRLPHRPRGGAGDGGHGRGTIFLTGATASVRGGEGFAAFASAKLGLRAVAQSMARELGPRDIHVAHVVIDGGVGTAFVRTDRRTHRDDLRRRAAGARPAAQPGHIAETYWQLHRQPRDAWTHELDMRPSRESLVSTP